ncbi:MAG TPA: RNA polymerase sigma factor [Solirubrobacteraceae bacterium]|nr:RNA polymerase sigma factor [Solirubrobacteraceae bacterium]
MTATDEELLGNRDALSFELFYGRYFNRVLAFFSRRTRDAELAADLTAETFAAALAARRRYRPHGGTADSWLFGIAYHKLADSQRRGRADDRARRRLGIERIKLTDDDIARIDRIGDPDVVTELVEKLPAEQRQAIRARVIDEREYDEIAQTLHVSEAVVRKRVSRGLARLRSRIGGPS